MMEEITAGAYDDPCYRPQVLVKSTGFKTLPLLQFTNAIEGFTVRELQALSDMLSEQFEREERELLQLL